jgi:O-antigen/teichoic acid export membrane protein
MIVSTVVLIVLQFAARVLAIRAISPEQWGEFSLGIALTGILALVAAIGLPTAVARSLAYESTARARWKLIRTVTWASAGSGLTGSLLIYLGAPYFASAFHNAALTPIFQLFSVTVAFGVFSVILAA